MSYYHRLILLLRHNKNIIYVTLIFVKKYNGFTDLLLEDTINAKLTLWKAD